MKKQITKKEYSVVERNGQLKIALNTEIRIGKEAPVRLTDAQLEALDYRKLYQAYSSKGRKPVTEPRVLFKVLAYASQIHIYSNRQIEEACRNRIDMLWLLDGHPVPEQSTIARFKKRCADEIEDLFYQYTKELERQGETDHEVIFIDGTKIESRAGKYTFCWRGTVEKRLKRVREQVEKETGLKTLRGLQKRLEKTEPGEPVRAGKGHAKSEEQKKREKLESLSTRWAQYEASLKIMGERRNSYSRTDPDATFMRMKEDAMKNGQLKPAYNVQIGVNSEYITGIEVFSDRTDSRTMEPFLQQMKKRHGKVYRKVTADAGYESLDNYLYLEENGQIGFIKPKDHEVSRTKKYLREIGRAENMEYDAGADCYTCAQGRKLHLYRESKDPASRHDVTVSHYRCEDCRACPRREECCKITDREKPKELSVRKLYQEKRALSEARILSEEGIYLRLCRSIQAEGAFGLIKHDFGFRRFLTRGKRNVRTELFLLGFGFNLKKRWKKQSTNRLKLHLSILSTA